VRGALHNRSGSFASDNLLLRVVSRKAAAELPHSMVTLLRPPLVNLLVHVFIASHALQRFRAYKTFFRYRETCIFCLVETSYNSARLQSDWNEAVKSLSLAGIVHTV
jgi:hypothetical protein